MIRQMGFVLLLALMGTFPVGAQPKAEPTKLVPEVRAKVKQFNLDKNAIFLLTDRDVALPPLTIGKDVRLFLDGREVAMLRDMKPEELTALVNRDVKISFRDEGKRHVVDTVRTLPRESRRE